MIRDYLVKEGTPSRVMVTWPRHIDRFKRQYEKSFTGYRLFVADRIHKQVQLLLHSCNTTSLEDVETGYLEGLIELQIRMESGEWTTPPPAWVDIPAQKSD